MTRLLKDEFNAAMKGFGPFPAKPRLAIGVSGGADSTALVLLSQAWAASCGGSVRALIVDHGLRLNSGEEANLTRQRLEARGIEARVITLTGLGHPKLQETARRARHAALATATREARSLYLLLGHQAADQAETVAMRAKRGNQGLEGMADWTARNDAVLLRPLLTVAPIRLREFLRQENMPWVEDPSNDDRQFERVRVRGSRIDDVPHDPMKRQAAETSLARYLARHTIIRPEGFALILADAAPPAALGALLRTIGGADYAPRQESLTKIAAQLRPATLGGVRIMNAGRLGKGWLLVREYAACGPPVTVNSGSTWDRRYRIVEDGQEGICGAVGADTSLFRDVSNMPAAILKVLPCIRMPNASHVKPRVAKAIFVPPLPMAQLPFRGPASGAIST